MADLEKLKDMLDALMDDKGEEAQIAFHSYTKEKMQDLIHPPVDNASDDE